tara:strand:+ start:69 stop:689 length:621 start_codon:yes stop_codon:yes gene_type:complete
MKNNRMNDDFIGIYENSVSQELCESLVDWFDACSERKFTIRNVPFRRGEKVKTTARSDESITIPNYPAEDNYQKVSSLSIPIQLCEDYWNALNKCYYDYAETYDLEWMELSSYTFKMHKVQMGQGYHNWHFENDGSAIVRGRILAWMSYLNAPEEGGETEFLYQHKRIKPEMGMTLIWPASFTHYHRGNPPLKGEKYYITGWFERE